MYNMYSDNLQLHYSETRNIIVFAYDKSLLSVEMCVILIDRQWI